MHIQKTTSDFNAWASDDMSPFIQGYSWFVWQAASQRHAAALTRLTGELKQAKAALREQREQDVARGHYSAVAIALCEEGATTLVRLLFSQGGDLKHALPGDLKLFQECGLTAYAG